MKRIGLTSWILIGLVVGVTYGKLFPGHAGVMATLASLFIRLIKMLVAPIIFSTLVVGLAGAGHQRIGRLLAKALAWFWVATAAALVIGLGIANTLRPGVGAMQAGNEAMPPLATPIPFYQQVVPESIFAGLANNSILQIVFFSVLFAVSLAAIAERHRQAADTVLQGLRGVAEAMFKMTDTIMRLAPIGVAAAMAAAVGKHGLGVMGQLAKLVGSLYLALVIFVVLHLVVMKVFAGIHLRATLKALREPLLLAFSTSSSESALPKAIHSMERLGVPPHIVGFVLPAGYSFNLTGSTLYMALAAMFIAQATHLDLSVKTQILMMLTLLVASKGVAAVPRASLVVLASTCAQFGLKVEWIATILSVDALMDMARTTVNVLGNCMASVIVARWEGALPKDAPLYTGRLPPEEKSEPSPHAQT